MYGFGLVGLLVVLAIVGFVFVKPELSMLPSASEQTQQSGGISGARAICLASAKAALAMDLQIAGLQCPSGVNGPDALCAQSTPEGAKAYAKFVSAQKGCGHQ